MTKILCIHHNHLYRQCLTWVLSRDERLKEVEFVELDHDLSDLKSAIAREKPDVLLIELALEHPAVEHRTVDLTEYARNVVGARVVLLIARALEAAQTFSLLVECVKAGAQGYVLEEYSLDQLGEALGRVIDGDGFWSPKLVNSMVDTLGQLGRETKWRKRLDEVNLTDREREILHCLAEGLSNKEVAKELSLSLYTVKNHVHRIISKMKATNRTDAVRRAIASQVLIAD